VSSFTTFSSGMPIPISGAILWFRNRFRPSSGSACQKS